MSCGICNKWQHIPCHDNADLKAGRRKRDWDIEEFVCQRCQPRGSRKYDGAYQQRQHQDRHSQQPYTTEQMAYIQPVANLSTPRSQPGYAGVPSYVGPTSSGQNVHDNFRTSTPSSMAQQRPHQAPSGITFAHYQPDPHGFSTRQTYQRDQVPDHNQTYERQPQFVSRPSQQLQSEMATNLRTVQVRIVVEF